MEAEFFLCKGENMKIKPQNDLFFSFFDVAWLYKNRANLESLRFKKSEDCRSLVAICPLQSVD